MSIIKDTFFDWASVDYLLTNTQSDIVEYFINSRQRITVFEVGSVVVNDSIGVGSIISNTFNDIPAGGDH